MTNDMLHYITEHYLASTLNKLTVQLNLITVAKNCIPTLKREKKTYSSGTNKEILKKRKNTSKGTRSFSIFFNRVSLGFQTLILVETKSTVWWIVQNYFGYIACNPLGIEDCTLLRVNWSEWNFSVIGGTVIKPFQLRLNRKDDSSNLYDSSVIGIRTIGWDTWENVLENQWAFQV